MNETPKKKLPGRGRPEKQPSCNNFCRLYSVNSKHITESTIKIVFLRRISSKNQREQAGRNVVLSTCLRNSVFPASNRVCSKYSTKICNAVQLMRFLRSGFAASRSSASIQYSPTAAEERFKRMSSSPHSANPRK